MAECCDTHTAQSHLSSKATAFSIASLMASDENGTFNILLLLFLFISNHYLNYCLQRQVVEVTILKHFGHIYRTKDGLLV